MSRYDGAKPVGWKSAAACYAIFAVLALVLFAPAHAYDLSAWGGACPDGMVATGDNACTTAGPPPPTQEQLDCIERWEGRDNAAEALDLGTTAVGVAVFGGGEVGVSALCGGAWPVCLVALKLGSRTIRHNQRKHLMATGQYDKLCNAYKVRAGITGAIGVSNIIGIAR